MLSLYGDTLKDGLVTFDSLDFQIPFQGHTHKWKSGSVLRYNVAFGIQIGRLCLDKWTIWTRDVEWCHDLPECSAFDAGGLWEGWSFRWICRWSSLICQVSKSMGHHEAIMKCNLLWGAGTWQSTRDSKLELLETYLSRRHHGTWHVLLILCNCDTLLYWKWWTMVFSWLRRLGILLFAVATWNRKRHPGYFWFITRIVRIPEEIVLSMRAVPKRLPYYICWNSLIHSGES